MVVRRLIGPTGSGDPFWLSSARDAICVTIPVPRPGRRDRKSRGTAAAGNAGESRPCIHTLRDGSIEGCALHSVRNCGRSRFRVRRSASFPRCWSTRNDDIRKIIAGGGGGGGGGAGSDPQSLLRLGVHGAIYSFDSQTSKVHRRGIQEKVERQFEANIRSVVNGRTAGRSTAACSTAWTEHALLRPGERIAGDQRDRYTAQSEVLQLQPGYNINHTWQLQYTARFRTSMCCRDARQNRSIGTRSARS